MKRSNVSWGYRSAAALAAALIAVVLLFVRRGAAEETPVPTPNASYTEFGLLETQVRQVRRPNCWTLTLRGNVENPYDQPVKGLRMVVRLLQAGDDANTVERFETALPMEIPAKGSISFNRELTTGCTTSFNNLSVVTFADHRGGVELPEPGPEVEIGAAKTQDANNSGGGVNPLGNVGSWGVSTLNR